MTAQNRYEQIIEAIFFAHHKEGMTEFTFEREEIEDFTRKLKMDLPKNLGDLVYSFRYRASLPAKILSCAPEGQHWLILPAGRSRYRFVLRPILDLTPSGALSAVKVPDSTPGVIALYALSDEQALLAKLRYNRLIDIFTRATCFSLQNHLRTTVPDVGQVETDEIYVGVDRRGAHYVFPIQAKGGKDKLSVVQIQQDFALCAHKFPALICRPIAAQFLDRNTIALFEFVDGDEGIRASAEKHYRLVAPEDLTPDDLEKYKGATDEEN